MSEEFYTVEHAAQRLKLHVKTVLRFVRDGRLRAAKVGKQYRILRSDLEAFGGARPQPPAAARVTSIVDIPGVDAEVARRITAHLPAARMGADAHADPMSLTFAHDPTLGHLKVVIVGSPADTAAMLKMLQVYLEP
ncbi:MAG: helix-turn-helix domain-containing protein [Phenylobacterium sp.]